VSDHRDTPDQRTDITDLYVFRAPRGGDRSVLVLNINPDASALESSFDPAARVLEVPNSALGSAAGSALGSAAGSVLGSAAGSAAPLRLWARTMAPVHGTVAQLDTAGRPGIATAFNRTDADRAGFNETSPTDQLARHGARFVAALRSMGYSEAEAGELVAGLLPDVLEYDPSRPGGYPNGRRLTDDVVDLMTSMMTRGRLTGDGVGPHADLLDEFPYLGPPHAVRV